MANGVSTEWDDIQRKLGNFEAKERIPAQWELNQAAREKLIEHENDPENKKEVEDSDDDFDDEDDDFFKQYQAKRMEEMKKLASKPHYGTVYEISKDQYIEQITNAPPESFVILHMYNDSNEYCLLINQYFTRLSAEYPLVKFVKIVATKCVETFPESSCPTFLIYKEGKMVGTYHSVDKLLGKITKDTLERFLHNHGVIYSENFVKANEEVEEIKSILNNPYKKGNGTGYMDKLDDREYHDFEIKQYKK